MSTNPLDVEEEQSAYVRLNILVSKDAIAKLDRLKDKSGLASRGRAIQILIEAVYDVQPDVKSIIELNNSATNTPPNGIPALFFKLLIYVSNILRRLAFIQ